MSAPVFIGPTGDMQKSVYDPNGFQEDAFQTNKELSIAFSYNTTSPLTLTNILAGQEIAAVKVTIKQAFDDLASQLNVGTVAVPSLMLATTDIVPTKIGDYTTEINTEIALAEILRLTINPAASTQGSGVVFVTLRRP